MCRARHREPQGHDRRLARPVSRRRAPTQRHRDLQGRDTGPPSQPRSRIAIQMLLRDPEFRERRTEVSARSPTSSGLSDAAMGDCAANDARTRRSGTPMSSVCSCFCKTRRRDAASLGQPALWSRATYSHGVTGGRRFSLASPTSTITIHSGPWHPAADPQGRSLTQEIRVSPWSRRTGLDQGADGPVRDVERALERKPA